MDPHTQSFLAHRSRARNIAYRMLGTVADAEDVVQDLWLRWQEMKHGDIESPEAWLVTAVTRMAIDRLRGLKRARENYPGIWLPAPVITNEDPVESPETALERLGEVSTALLALLERLTPESRAAFLMRDIFEADYAEIARVLAKSEAACRQLVQRARRALGTPERHRAVPVAEHRRLVEAFAAAAAMGRIDTLQQLLARDVELRGDGGGRVRSIPHALHGGQRVSQLYLASYLRLGERQSFVVVNLNAKPSLLRYVTGALDSAHCIDIQQGRIARIDVQLNPDKLAHLGQSLDPRP